MSLRDASQRDMSRQDTTFRDTTLRLVDAERIGLPAAIRGADPLGKLVYALLEAKREGADGITFPATTHTVGAGGTRLDPGEASLNVVGADGRPRGLSYPHDAVYDVEVVLAGAGGVRARIEPWDGSPTREYVGKEAPIPPSSHSAKDGTAPTTDHGDLHTFRFPDVTRDAPLPTIGGKCVWFEATNGAKFVAYRARGIMYSPQVRAAQQ